MSSPHPKIKDGYRIFVAKNSFFCLVLSYLVITIISSLIIGFCFYLGRHLYEPTVNLTFIQLSHVAFLQIFNTDTIDFNLVTIPPSHLLGYTVSKILAVLLPSILLSSIVFKLLMNKNTIVFKKKMNLYQDKQNKKYILAIRFYNSSKLMLTDLEVKSILRIKKVRGDDNAPYINSVQVKCNDYWHYATTNVPRTILINLEDEDFNSATLQLDSIHQNLISEKDELWVQVKGNVPEIGNSFTEIYKYKFKKDIAKQQWTEIHVDYDKKPRRWAGWDDFED